MSSAFHDYTKKVLLEVLTAPSIPLSYTLNVPVTSPKGRGKQLKTDFRKQPPVEREPRLPGETDKEYSDRMGRMKVASERPKLPDPLSPQANTSAIALGSTYGQQQYTGANLPQQAGWANYKKAIDAALSGISTGALLGTAAGPMTSAVDYAAKQAIKASLAKQYLGVTGGFSASLTAPVSAAVTAIQNALSGNMAGVAGAHPFISTMGATTASPLMGGGRFGKLGEKLAGRVDELAALGYDPLDWALTQMGAYDASEVIARSAATSSQAAESMGGYLQKGRQLGIYK